MYTQLLQEENWLYPKEKHNNNNNNKKQPKITWLQFIS